MLATFTKTRSEMIGFPLKSPLAKCAKFSMDIPSSAAAASTGTTGRVVKIWLAASISRATAVNIPPSAAIQRTDPEKSEAMAFGNIWSMNRALCPSASKSPLTPRPLSLLPPCIR